MNKWTRFIDFYVSNIARRIQDEFDENKHPRDTYGKFTNKGVHGASKEERDTSAPFKKYTNKQLSKITGVDERYVHRLVDTIETAIKEGWSLNNIPKVVDIYSEFLVGYTPSKKFSEYARKYAEDYLNNNKISVDFNNPYELNNATESIQSALRGGKNKGYVDSDIKVKYDKETNKLHLIYSIDRKFRHPDEYYNEEDLEYGNVQELKDYNKWRQMLNNRIKIAKERFNLNGVEEFYESDY